jgi:predicted Ser/Thr protein kinase
MQKESLNIIDLDSIERILDYAIAKMDVEIQAIRGLLSKTSESTLRHEFLARIDSLQLVKSQLSIKQLSDELSKSTDPEQEPQHKIYE